jgi:hypothetical protein
MFERLSARIPEQPFCTRIPKANDAVPIRGNDCIGATAKEGLGHSVGNVHRARFPSLFSVVPRSAANQVNRIGPAQPVNRAALLTALRNPKVVTRNNALPQPFH